MEDANNMILLLESPCNLTGLAYKVQNGAILGYMANRIFATGLRKKRRKLAVQPQNTVRCRVDPHLELKGFLSVQQESTKSVTVVEKMTVCWHAFQSGQRSGGHSTNPFMRE
ncbi:hypothetical protein C8J57DRAFT_1241046 [Mycena rebaudengoi]|nr:hypothetical protein C8J57DRAFT_1241046 [Mycena rebaudengoi]